MKTVGIIGGIAPESTIQYYRLIIAGYRERVREGDYPSILINSINMKRMLDLIGDGRLAETVGYLKGEIDRLARAGADFAVLASNTPHLVFDDLQAVSPIRLISIVEEARRRAEEMGLHRVGLFGTRFTMQGGFYQREFEKTGMTLFVPGDDDQGYIHEKYMTELVNGTILEDTRAGLLRAVGRLKREHRIQGLVLGGTELPLILKDGGDPEVPFLDTTAIHVQSIVRELL
jgi:aspartate racemase